MKRLIYLVTTILLFSVYLIYSFNNLKGRSYIFEPVYISLEGNIPENTRLELTYRTVNDPSKNRKTYPIISDSIPENIYIFRIDSSYRLADFSIYFLALPEEETFTITQIKASNPGKGEFSFSLKPKDLMAAGSLTLNQLTTNTISLRRITSDSPVPSTLYFITTEFQNDVFVRTNIRIPEIPSPLASILIVLLGICMVFVLYPIVATLKFSGISSGAYLLALAVLILPTGEKSSNLLLAMALGAGIIQGLIKGTFRILIRENRRVLLLAIMLMLLYILAFVFNRSATSPVQLLVVKFGLPLALIAVAVTTNNKNEIRLQYVALLTGVIVSVFIHFGWAVMFVDSVELKTKIISNPHYFLESAVFSRVHHSYLSVIYMVALTMLYFKRDLLPLRRRENIIIVLLIVIALLFAFSRAAILSLGLIILFFSIKSVFHLLKLEISHISRFAAAAVITLALFALIFSNFKVDPPGENLAVQGLQTRVAIWKNAAELIKQKPLTGWGPENYKSALEESNKLDAFNSNSWRMLNTHNQFLETSGMFGLVVGISLIWFLLFPTGFSRQDIKYEDFILTVAIIFITGFLFESMLNRNLGILVFGLYYGLLIKMRPTLH